MKKTLFVSRFLVECEPLIDWATKQGFVGVKNDPHVTIAYSKEPVDWDQFRPHESNYLNLDDRRSFDLFGAEKNVVVLRLYSPVLKGRWKEFIRGGASWDWDDYHPHITITENNTVDLDNITPYTGALTFGPEIFEEVDESK